MTATTPGAPTMALTVFCRWLRPVHRQLGEGNEEFALRVQQVVGYTGRVELGLPLSREERRLETLTLPIQPSDFP